VTTVIRLSDDNLVRFPVQVDYVKAGGQHDAAFACSRERKCLQQRTGGVVYFRFARLCRGEVDLSSAASYFRFVDGVGYGRRYELYARFIGRRIGMEEDFFDKLRRCAGMNWGDPARGRTFFIYNFSRSVVILIMKSRETLPRDGETRARHAAGRTKQKKKHATDNSATCFKTVTIWQQKIKSEHIPRKIHAKTGWQ
jgi:hypothetical protein